MYYYLMSSQTNGPFPDPTPGSVRRSRQVCLRISALARYAGKNRRRSEGEYYHSTSKLILCSKSCAASLLCSASQVTISLLWR